jgi:hypothetical protein
MRKLPFLKERNPELVLISVLGPCLLAFIDVSRILFLPFGSYAGQIAFFFQTLVLLVSIFSAALRFLNFYTLLSIASHGKKFTGDLLLEVRKFDEYFKAAEILKKRLSLKRALILLAICFIINLIPSFVVILFLDPAYSALLYNFFIYPQILCICGFGINIAVKVRKAEESLGIKSELIREGIVIVFSLFFLVVRFLVPSLFFFDLNIFSLNPLPFIALVMIWESFVRVTVKARLRLNGKRMRQKRRSETSTRQSTADFPLSPVQELISLLDNPKEVEKLQEYMQKEFTLENLQFLLAVRIFKREMMKITGKQDTEQIRKCSKTVLKIYLTYIDEFGPLTINVSAAVRKLIKSFLNAPQNAAALFQNEESVLEWLVKFESDVVYQCWNDDIPSLPLFKTYDNANLEILQMVAAETMIRYKRRSDREVDDFCSVFRMAIKSFNLSKGGSSSQQSIRVTQVSNVMELPGIRAVSP